MPIKKRTKKQYETLFSNAETLFPGVTTTLWPNGEPEIWFANKDGYGFRVRVSDGPAGLGMTVSRFTGTPGLTVNGNKDDGDFTPFAGPDMYEVTLTQYRQDEHSQQFKKWYAGECGADGERISYPEKENDK